MSKERNKKRVIELNGNEEVDKSEG